MSRHRPARDACPPADLAGTRRRVGLTGAAAVLALGLTAAPLPFVAASTSDVASVPPRANAADLDILYVGAHPDDEASRLSMFGEWKERYGAKTGVVTITRGEGGGNAVGPEEGPALGLIREREERAAVGTADITSVYNLDKVDFYYSVSAPLHQEAWKQHETLGRLVRIIRETTPDVVMTMNPAPSPGNHGGHQDAALLLIAAYYAAGDPSMFPAQIRREGLEPFAPKKLFTTQARGQLGAPGANCGTTFTPTNPADDIYGVWSGRRAENGKTWAQIEREAQRRYASQGWSGFPDVNADPAQLTCDYMTQIDSRVPFVRGDLTAGAAASSTMLEGALLRSIDGLPLGTGLDLSTDDFELTPGAASSLRVTLTAPEDASLSGVRLKVALPTGWSGPSRLRVGRVTAGETVTKSLSVIAPSSAQPGRSLVGVTLRSSGRTGFTD